MLGTEAKETNPEMPLIPENDLKSNEFPLQTFPMKSEDSGEVDNVIQDYIDQVAATNLKQRRANFAEANDLELAIPEVRPGGVGLAPSPGGRNARFSSPVTPRSALKKVSNIPEEPEEIEPVPADLVTDIENQKHHLKSEKEFLNAKNLLRHAFVEFYRGLGLLSTFRY